MRMIRVLVLPAAVVALSWALPVPEQCGQLQKLTASDGLSGDFYGWSVAAAGDSVAVGARNHPFSNPEDPKYQAGAVYTYKLQGGTWVLEGKLMAPAGDDNQYDAFGHSVSYDRGLLAIGAVGDDGDTGNSNFGAVYVFRKAPAGWVLEAKLAPPAGGDVVGLGESIFLWDDTLIATADTTAGAGGAAFVYRRTGTTWALEAKLSSSNPDSRDFESVGLFQNVVLLGAPDAKIQNVPMGAVYVFRRTGSTWHQTQEIPNPSGDGGDSFGASTAIYGRLSMIGAPLKPVGEVLEVGSVYVYSENAIGQLSPGQVLVPSAVDEGEQFGNALAMVSATNLAGAWLFDHLALRSGAAFQFKFVAGSWNQVAFHPNPDPAQTDHFGRSVALGNYAVMGTPRDDQVAIDAGAAYVYSVCP